MTRVLVVEDEPQLVRVLEINLKARKYEVESASDGGTGLRHGAHAATRRRPRRLSDEHSGGRGGQNGAAPATVGASSAGVRG